MTFKLNELPINAARFARHCIERKSIIELVNTSQLGINRQECEQWGITEEQWQDAIFAVLRELR